MAFLQEGPQYRAARVRQAWNKSRRKRSRRFLRPFPMETKMQHTHPCQAELDALRNLEKAVRACGLPTIMVSGQQQLEILAAALRDIEQARKASAG